VPPSVEGQCFHLRKLSTFQTTGLQASIFKYWLTASLPPLPNRTIHPLLLAKRYNSLTLSHKLHVLCHKSLKDISPRIGHHNKERLRLVYAVQSRATGARHRHRRICKSSLLKWKHWPSTEGGTHGAQPQNWCDFFNFFAKCFRNKSESVSEMKVILFKTKIFSFKNHLRNESVFETRIIFY